MGQQQQPTTIAIFGRDSAVVENVLALLWPSRLEDLRRAASTTLTPTTNSKDSAIRSLGGALAAQQENAHDRPQPERYYSEYIRLPADEEAAHETLRGAINERKARGWKLISAIKEPSGDVLLLEWDTLGDFSK